MGLDCGLRGVTLETGCFGLVGFLEFLTFVKFFIAHLGQGLDVELFEVLFEGLAGRVFDFSADLVAFFETGQSL